MTAKNLAEQVGESNKKKIFLKSVQIKPDIWLSYKEVTMSYSDMNN